MNETGKNSAAAAATEAGCKQCLRYKEELAGLERRLIGEAEAHKANFRAASEAAATESKRLAAASETVEKLNQSTARMKDQIAAAQKKIDEIVEAAKLAQAAHGEQMRAANEAIAKLNDALRQSVAERNRLKALNSEKLRVMLSANAALTQAIHQQEMERKDEG